MNGNKRKDASEIIAGDIAAAMKLKDTHAGDTLALSKHPITFKTINYPEPNMRFAVSPESRGEEDKMAAGLATMHEEDPTFLYKVDPELKQTIRSSSYQGKITVKDNLEEATVASIEIARTTNSNSIILSPACASFDQYQNYEERGNHFKSLIKNFRNLPPASKI